MRPDTVSKSLTRTANAAETWNDYLRRWTGWNHLRTAAALLATLSFCLGLARQGLAG